MVLTITLLNCNGRVGSAVATMQSAGADVILLTETKPSEGNPLPLPDGWRAFQAARPASQGSGGGVAALARQRLAAEQWRSVPEDGVLWLRLPGALAGGRTLALAVCYHRPPAPGRAAAEEDADWYARRAAEWVAAVESDMVPVLAGDLNAHTATAPDWPAEEAGTPRCSTDSKCDRRGMLLLQFCADLGACIANGRAAGDSSGAATSFGTRGTASSVVDYFVVPTAYLSQVRELLVSEELAVADHSGLVMRIEAASGSPPAATTLGLDPCFLRFPRCPAPARVEAAAAELQWAWPAIEALAEAAQRADTPAAAESVAHQRCILIAGACQGAGIRPLGCAKRGGSSAVGLPHWAARQFRLRELRAALRQARRQHRGAAEHVTARRALQRATQRAERAARSVRGTQLERQLLEQHDAAGFHQTYRGPQGGVPDFVLREPDAVLAHFVALLAPPTAASPPEGSTAAGGGAGAAPQEGSVAEAAAALAAAQQATQADMQAAVAAPPPESPTHQVPPPPTTHPHPLAATLPESLFDHEDERPEALAASAGEPIQGRSPPMEALPGRPEGSPGPCGRGAEAGDAEETAAAAHMPAQAAPLAAAATAAHPALDRTPTAPPSPSQPPPTTLAQLARLRDAMEAAFTAEEVASLARRTAQRKAVFGPLAPWLLKQACAQLAPLAAAEFNAWQRIGRLPRGDAHSAIALVAKTSSPTQPSDLRGIAVGALLAKLFAAGLERRVTAHAEAAGLHAEGQFGFRRQRSTEQAALALRTVIECHRQQRQCGGSSTRSEQPQRRHTRRRRRQRGGSQLWACFVDFKQAYDRVPRAQLWQRLESMGYGGQWLRAVRALYADVPMSVTAPGLEGRVFSATQGLKQGCPLSPTLFSLYIADWEERVLSAAAAGMPLALPQLAGQPVPPLLYADDMALLATTANGLQQQLRLLEQYCAERGLTVNVVKTKVMLLSGAADEQTAMQRVRRARHTFDGAPVAGVAAFKYLGLVFHCTQPVGEAAAEGRARVARFAAASFEGRCTALGLEAARLLLSLYRQMVDSTLSYGAAVWSPGLALAAVRRLGTQAGAAGGGSGLSAAEQQHYRTLRRLLGLPQRAPRATVLAETGEPPLHAHWLARTARFWNSLVPTRAAPPRRRRRAAAARRRRRCRWCSRPDRAVPTPVLHLPTPTDASKQVCDTCPVVPRCPVERRRSPRAAFSPACHPLLSPSPLIAFPNRAPAHAPVCARSPKCPVLHAPLPGAALVSDPSSLLRTSRVVSPRPSLPRGSYSACPTLKTLPPACSGLILPKLHTPCDTSHSNRLWAPTPATALESRPLPAVTPEPLATAPRASLPSRFPHAQQARKSRLQKAPR